MFQPPLELHGTAVCQRISPFVRDPLRSAAPPSLQPRARRPTPMAVMIPTSLGALAALRVPVTGQQAGLAYCSAPASPADRDGALQLRSPAGSDPGSGEERGDLSNLHSRLLKSFEVRLHIACSPSGGCHNTNKAPNCPALCKPCIGLGGASGLMRLASTLTSEGAATSLDTRL